MPKLALEQGISIEETSYTPINVLLWQLMIAETLYDSKNPGRWNADIYYYWQLIIAEGFQLVLLIISGKFQLVLNASHGNVDITYS